MGEHPTLGACAAAYVQVTAEPQPQKAKRKRMESFPTGSTLLCFAAVSCVYSFSK
jgi:hypothetical protein